MKILRAILVAFVQDTFNLLWLACSGEILTQDKRKGVYAGYKKLRATNLFLFRVAIVSASFTILGFFIGLFSSEYYYGRSQRAARQLSNVTMSRPVPFVRKLPVIIEDGGNEQEMPTPGRYGPAISRCPFSFLITPDGSINLRGEIRDGKGNIAVEGTGDSIRVIQADRYDVNSDTKAIEVVDTNQRPVFQLMVTPCDDFIKEKTRRRSKLTGTIGRQIEAPGVPDANVNIEDAEQQMRERLKEKRIDQVIRLFYITQQGKTWWISSPDGSCSVESLEDDKVPQIPRLFCYPGYSQAGKRVDQ